MVSPKRAERGDIAIMGDLDKSTRKIIVSDFIKRNVLYDERRLICTNGGVVFAEPCVAGEYDNEVCAS